jgi:hypothetical protein
MRLSGSPAFVSESILDWKFVRAKRGRQKRQVAYTGQYYLMGLMHGHWNLRPEDRNKNWITTDSQCPDRVNMGIAVVVPAKKILEVLDHPELVRQRDQAEEDHFRMQGTTEPD